MKRMLCLAGLLAMASAGAVHAEDFVRGGWLCMTADAHREAVAQAEGLDEEALEALKDRLYMRRQCFWLDGDNLRQVVTGVRILETEGDLARVSFGMQQGDQMPGQVRAEQFYRMMVWTARDNLTREDEADSAQ